MRRLALLIFVALALIAAYLYRTGTVPFRNAAANPTLVEEAPIDPNEVRVLSALDAEYSRLVDAVVPSVVSITTSRTVRVPYVVDQFDYFFGRRGRNRPAEQTQSGLGSGVIVSKEGHIITNHHVIEGMDEIRVQLTDGRIEPAELIGSDKGVDIAVLRVKAPNLRPLPFGDSESVRVGQMVFAIGNPFGLQETVTQGIVSAKGRAISDSGVELLQTDAAVNPGNSGGPLLNLRGEIIGINSAIYSRTGAWAGISFAIPANTARQTMEVITQTGGKIVRPYMGVVMMDIDRRLADEFQLPDSRGALITDVIPGSPAQQAGLQAGDVIRTYNGHLIRNTRELRRRLLASKVGEEVGLGVIRNGTEMNLTARPAEMPSDESLLRVPPAPTPAQPPPEPGQSGRRAPTSAVGNVLSGIVVNDIPERLRRSLPENIPGGVIITQVDPQSPAAGLRVGDIIEEVNQQPVRSVEDYDRLAAAVKPGQRVLLFVARGNTRSFVVITP
ncbi:MAG: Do family serine endopeptidase [Chthoniobacteraceae bacterium]